MILYYCFKNNLRQKNNRKNQNNAIIKYQYRGITKYYYLAPLRKPIRTIINNSYHISSMLLVASRKIRTYISLGIYEARYDRKIARMVAQSILVGLLGEAGVAQESQGRGVRGGVRGKLREVISPSICCWAGAWWNSSGRYKLTNLIAQ